MNGKQKEYTVKDTNLTKNTLIEKNYISKEYINEILKADIIVLPMENIRNGLNISYPEGTENIIDEMKEKLGINIEFAVDDDKYIELQLHSADITTPILYVTGPIILGVITNLIYDFVKSKYNGIKDKPIVVKFEIYQENKKGCKHIKYEGPLEGLKDIVENDR